MNRLGTTTQDVHAERARQFEDEVISRVQYGDLRAPGRDALLGDYGVLDDAIGGDLDDIVFFAARSCDAPMATISFVNGAQELFASTHGTGSLRAGHDLMFCREVVETGEPLLVEDAHSHPRFSSSPLVTEAPHVRAYFGVPLIAPEGVAIGAFAAMDSKPRTFTTEQQLTLRTLAAQVMVHLELQRRQCTLADRSVAGALDMQPVFSALPVALLLLDMSDEFHVLAISDEMLRHTGRERGNVVGKPLFEIFPADPNDPGSFEGVENLRRSLQRVCATGKPDRLVMQRYPIPNGQGGFDERFWTAINQPVRDRDGRLRYILHQSEDVTELVHTRRHAGEVHEMRHKQERMSMDIERRASELRRVNEHLRQAQRVAKLASWELRLPGFERSWSDEMFHILGVTPDMGNPEGDSVLRFVHPDDRERVLAARDRALQGGEIPEVEHRIVRPDGVVRHVVQRARLVTGADGRPEALYGTMQDVTEHRRVEEEIQARAHQQAAVAQLGQLALRETHLHIVFDAAATLVAETLRVEYCKILMRLPEHTGMKLVAGYGWQEGLVGKAIVGTGPESQAGYVLASTEPVIVEDLRKEQRFRGSALLHRHGVVSGISAIIHGEKAPWGVLGAHSRTRRRFSRDDVNFIRSVCNILAESIHRIRVEQALRRSEQRTRRIIDTSLDAVVAIDVNSVITDWNVQAERTFGWRRDEALGQRLHELIIPRGYRQAHLDGMRRYLKTGEGKLLNQRVEVTALRRDGSEFPVELAVSPLEAEGRTSFSAFIRDITERRAAEDSVRENVERFRMVSKATADTIWDWNLQTDAVWWSEGMRKVFGYEADELEIDSASFNSRIHPEDKPAVERALRDAIAGEDDEWSMQYRFRRRDGSYAFVAVRGYVIRDENGRPIRMVGGMNDITETKEYENRLAQQAALLDKAQDAIIVRDTDNIITYWNKGAERLYGWTSEEACGRRMNNLLQPASDTFDDALREVFETGEWNGQNEKRHKDGRRIVIEGGWTLVRNANGEPQSILTIDTDITERLALEEQLRQSQRLESVGQLTGGVAHDFNNLLTVILGNAELMESQLNDSPRLRKLAHMTRTAAQRGAELTHRLLAFARRQALEPKVVDVNELVARMHGLLQRTLLENIDIEVVPGEELWGAYADPAQLESVLLNLAINAKDAMPDGGRLTIETANARLDEEYAAHHAEVAPGRYVMLAVSDTGTGIAPENLAHVFDPFFTTKEKGKGTGLGLSMAYGFAKQSQGHIAIYSEPGQGTTVRVYLPRAERTGDIVQESVRATALQTGNEKILVVEDDELVRQHAANQLEDFGYRVLTARNGSEAVDLMRYETDIDLLFTDVIMSGGMNGRELAEVARRLSPKMKVLFTSGYTENAIVHHGRLDPGVHLLQKPYQRAELARKVRVVLNEQTAADSRG